MDVKKLSLLLLLFVIGCISQSPPSEPTTPLNGTQIQENFENAFFSMKAALDTGNIKEAEESYHTMTEMYEKAKNVVGKEHLDFFVLEEELELLGEKLDSGDLEDAKLLSAEIGGGCGVKFCHARAGSSMAKLEVEYGNIKKAIEEDNLSEAEKHLSDFKKYWTESKKDVSIIMPRITEVLMRDEYLKELEKAIESRNETEAKKAISLISNTTCSFTGCHRVFFETMTLWKF